MERPWAQWQVFVITSRSDAAWFRQMHDDAAILRTEVILSPAELLDRLESRSRGCGLEGRWTAGNAYRCRACLVVAFAGAASVVIRGRARTEGGSAHTYSSVQCWEHWHYKVLRQNESTSANYYEHVSTTATICDLARQSMSCIHNSFTQIETCLLYTSPSPRDRTRSRMPSSA